MNTNLITKYLAHKETIAVTVPFQDIIDIEIPWGKAAYALLLGKNPSCLCMCHDLKCNHVHINYLEDEFFHAVIGEAYMGHNGFRVDWAKNSPNGSEPFIKILKEDLIEEYDNNFKYENETHYLIPIRSYVDNIRVGGDHARTEQIIEWFTAYSNVEEDYSNLVEELQILHSDADAIKQMIIDEGFETVGQPMTDGE